VSGVKVDRRAETHDELPKIKKVSVPLRGVWGESSLVKIELPNTRPLFPSPCGVFGVKAG